MMRSGPNIRQRMLAAASAAGEAMAQSAAWPKACVSCGLEEIKRGPGAYWQCPRCGVDGGSKSA